MKWLAAVAALMFACRGHEGAPVAQGSAFTAGSAVGSAAATQGSARDPWVGAGSARDPWAGATSGSARDPWAGESAGSGSAGELPSLVERHELAEAACPRVTGPYFFRVEKGGKTNYLLGTRHVGVPLAKFPQVVRDTIDHARLAVFEVAPDDKSSISRSDIDVAAAVGPADWQKYVELVGQDTADIVAHGRPDSAAIQMLVEFEDISAMLDTEIEHEVGNQHIPARGLEASAFQDDLLDKLLDVRALKEQIEQTKDRAELQQESHDDLAEYCAGTDEEPGTDAKDRKKMLAGGYTNAEIDHIDDLMVFQRNASWIPKLEKMFADGGVFVAVGADHLIGNKGVVALLRGRGFTVTRVTQ